MPSDKSSVTSLIFQQMTSVERILEYTTLPQEADHEKKYTLPEEWPSYGRIKMENVSLKYSEKSPLALTGVDMSVQPQEKVSNPESINQRWLILSSVVSRYHDPQLQVTKN